MPRLVADLPGRTIIDLKLGGNFLQLALQGRGPRRLRPPPRMLLVSDLTRHCEHRARNDRVLRAGYFADHLSNQLDGARREVVGLLDPIFNRRHGRIVTRHLACQDTLTRRVRREAESGPPPAAVSSGKPSGGCSPLRSLQQKPSLLTQTRPDARAVHDGTSCCQYGYEALELGLEIAEQKHVNPPAELLRKAPPEPADHHLIFGVQIEDEVHITREGVGTLRY